MGQRTLFWRAARQYCRDRHYKRRHHDGFRVVAPKIIGLYWLLRTTVKGWDPVQPSSWCVVAALRVSHRQALASFMLPRCGRTRATGITWKIITNTNNPVRVLDICRPRLRHNTTAIQGSALVSSTSDFGPPRESAIPAEGCRGRLVPQCSLVGQGIVDFCGKGVSNNGHCIAAHAV